MTSSSTFTSITLGAVLSVSLLAAAACGGSDDGPAGSNSGASGDGGASGTAGTSSSGGSNSPGGACEAGSSVQGGGTDTCPSLAWRCLDRMVSTPPSKLAGAECSTGHTGGCCTYNDKCLTNTSGSNAQSAVEMAIAPCQAGCATNPSAQACVDCINANLRSAGKPALSSGCGTCYTSLISCSFNSCLTPCIAGSATPACRECVFNNCTIGAGKFNECSGTLNSAGL
jgi:hypothetical protein